MRHCSQYGSKMKQVANFVVRSEDKSGKTYRRRNVHRFKCTGCGHEESTSLTEEEE